jgi:hypothetical protein
MSVTISSELWKSERCYQLPGFSLVDLEGPRTDQDQRERKVGGKTDMVGQPAKTVPPPEPLGTSPPRPTMLTVLTCADVTMLIVLTYADVCWRMLTYADVCWHMLNVRESELIFSSRIFQRDWKTTKEKGGTQRPECCVSSRRRGEQEVGGETEGVLTLRWSLDRLYYRCASSSKTLSIDAVCTG